MHVSRMIDIYIYLVPTQNGRQVFNNNFSLCKNLGFLKQSPGLGRWCFGLRWLHWLLAPEWGLPKFKTNYLDKTPVLASKNFWHGRSKNLGNYGRPCVFKMYTIYRIPLSVFNEKWLIPIIKLKIKQWTMELRKHVFFVKPMASQTELDSDPQGHGCHIPSFSTLGASVACRLTTGNWDVSSQNSLANWIINANSQPNNNPTTTSFASFGFSGSGMSSCATGKKHRNHERPTRIASTPKPSIPSYVVLLD